MKTVEASILQIGDFILDVRSTDEHRSVSLAYPHWHVPMIDLDPVQFMATHPILSDRVLYLVCQSGGRSRIAAEKFIAAGFPSVVVVEGGIDRAVEQGAPVTQSLA